MDIRQSKEWGDYLSSIGWKVEKIGNSRVFIRNLPFLKYSVIKIQHPQNNLSFSEIDKFAKKHHSLFVILEPDKNNFNKEAVLKNGYVRSKSSLTHTSTIYIDINKSENKILSGFSENARRNIKKAQNNNLEIKIISLKDSDRDLQFKKFYSLLSNLTHLKKFYIPGHSEFHKKMMAFKNSSYILFAYHNVIAIRRKPEKQSSQPVAAVWLGILEDRAVYMNTGITKVGYETLANYLLVWESIKFAKSKKLPIFDFEGIYDPRFPKERKSWKNFSEFKKRFHGNVIEYPGSFIKIYNPVYKLLYLCSKILP
ncbi:MAG: peptidoglycan bridge formation glycyltransferase FemA/FemB family protein [Candidatus Daviesbacteria bacterium]|nr:peptidoglycan bridge formation glycyltransferase FemA/FemB family protein [Candidatus Daviesbacteria bacterium]